MNKQDIQSAGSQYGNGYLQGVTSRDPQLAQQASGHRNEFFLQGVEDARYGARRGLTSREANHVNEKLSSPEAVELLRVYREHISSQDERVKPQEVYADLMSITDRLMNRAAETGSAEELRALHKRLDEIETANAERHAQITGRVESVEKSSKPTT